MSLVTSFGSTKSLLQSSLCFIFLTALFATATTAAAAEKPILEAPTFEEVAKAIDLRKIKLPKGEKENVHRELTVVNFYVTGDGDELWKDLEKQLVALGCKPSKVIKDPNEPATFGRFEKDSFSLDASVVNYGDRWQVSIINFGKTNVSKIPHFGSARTNEHIHWLIDQDDQSIKSILDEAKAFLVADGFTHLGTSHKDYDDNESGRSVVTEIYMQKNASLVRLEGRFSVPPDKKGYVSVDTQLLSVDLPIPPNVENIDYLLSAGTSLHFETKSTSEQILKFYTDELSKRSWTRLQADDPAESLTVPLGREADNDRINATFGKTNVGRIEITGFRSLEDSQTLFVIVTFESAEDFLNAD
jgi:hypothetical protein